jgi:hypothetical protein
MQRVFLDKSSQFSQECEFYMTLKILQLQHDPHEPSKYLKICKYFFRTDSDLELSRTPWSPKCSHTFGLSD